MSQRLQIIALFCFGIVAGFAIAYYGFDNRQAEAYGGSDRAGEYIITSGLLEGSAGATYFLDSSTGTLTATVPNSRTRGMWGIFKADVSKHLKAYILQNPKDAFGQPVEMPSKPSYVMTATPLYVSGKMSGWSWPTEGVSVIETQTGIQLLYYIQFNSTKFKQGHPEQGDLQIFFGKQINPVMRRKQL